jgi:hypothetical protein
VPTLTFALLTLLLVLAAYAVFGRRRHVRLKRECLAALTRIYASTSPAPSFEMSYSYGEPVFQVRFASQGAMAAAADAGANAAFVQAIAELCKDRGRNRRFNAERAVFFEHPPVDARPVVHCCARMQAQADLADRPDALISYSASANAYGLRARARGTGAVAIAFCPWCAAPLPAPTPKSP